MQETHKIVISFIMDEMTSSPEASAEVLCMLLDEADLGYYIDHIVSAERI